MRSEAEVEHLFSTESMVRTMLDVEVALARAQARSGLIPASAAADIAATADASALDLTRLAQEAAEAGNLAIPLVRALTWRVADRCAESAGFVHWGATSQDIIDTALVLQMRRALRRIGQRLEVLRAGLREFAGEHRNTLMAARTLLQQALPTTFGLKAAYWLAPLITCHRRLHELTEELPVQFGGAAGTRAALGGNGTMVADGLATELGLRPSAPWHTDRTVVAELAASLGILCGNLSKIAGDMLLMSQTEVGELVERAPGGGSSTLPHKRNPVALFAVAAATRLAPGLVATVLACQQQSHERDPGGWHAERQAVAELFVATHTACAEMATALSRLEVDPVRMRHNLDGTDGLVMAESVAMALAARIGRDRAQTLVKESALEAETRGAPLLDTLRQNHAVTAVLDDATLEAALDPAGYLGDASRLIDSILRDDADWSASPPPRARLAS